MTTFAVDHTTRLCEKCQEIASRQQEVTVRAGTTKLNRLQGRLKVELVCEHLSSPSNA